MTSLTGVDTPILNIGPPDWCWSRLADSDEGILSYASLRGPIALAVPYLVAEQQILIPMASFNETGWLAVGGRATLEVTGTAPAGRRWYVRAVGFVERVPRFWPRPGGQGQPGWSWRRPDSAAATRRPPTLTRTDHRDDPPASVGLSCADIRS